MQAQEILKQCKREPEIKVNDIYVNLLYVTVLNTPAYKEEYILSETSEIFSNNENDFVLEGAAELLEESSCRNPMTIMKLYAMAVKLHAESGRIKEAENLLAQAKLTARKANHRMTYALYYDLLAEYYDILLNGAYDAEEPDEELLLDKLLNAIEQTQRYSKKDISCDGNHLYANSTLAKATILMRSGRGSGDEISRLIDTAQKIIMENTLPYADIRLHYYLVCGWYFALMYQSEEYTDKFVQKAQELSEKIIPTALRKIEEIIIPCANMYFELGCYGKSLSLLYEGTRLCVSHANTDSYARVKQELCEHIWQVGIEAQEFDLCRTIIELIDCENKDIVDPKNKVIIPCEIRNRIMNNSI